MKILGLFRHAKSDWGESDQRDFDRGLNGRGRRGAALMGDHIRDYGVAWDKLLASPAQRVKTTLESALPELTPEWDEKLYLASSVTLIERARAAGGDARALLLAGHNPGLQEVIFDMVSSAAENDLFDQAAAKFPTASFAVLECDIDDWADLKDDCARLVHLARPRDLDPELGPES